MKAITPILFLLVFGITNLTAQTKRFPFKYPSGKDSTGKTIYKQGLTDASGKLVVYPFYDWLNWDGELNLALGSISDKTGKNFNGYIDSTGFVVVPFKYNSLGWFNKNNIAQFSNEVPSKVSGFAANYNSPRKVYGFIDINGAELFNNLEELPGLYTGPQFSDDRLAIGNTIMPFSKSFITDKDSLKLKRFELVYSYGNYQYIYYDKYKKPVLIGINNSSADSLMFIQAFNFYKGIAAVRYPGANWKTADRFKEKNVLTLIDKSGKIVNPKKYNRVYNYYHGTRTVVIYDSTSKRFFHGLVDSTGKEFVPTIYRDIENFYESTAAVAIEGANSKSILWGIVDNKTGKVILPCKYQAVGELSEGLAAVMENNRWGFVNLKSEMVIPAKYVKVGYRGLQFKEGLAIVTTDTAINKKYGAIDKTGKTIIPFIYDDLSDFSEGLAAANKGKTISAGKYTWDYTVVADGKIGYINKTGKTIIPFDYQEGRNFKKGYADVTKDSLAFRIDATEKNTLSATPRILYAYNAGLVEQNNRNYKAAFSYFTEASAGGYSEADFALGYMYYAGTDLIKKNTAETVKLWTKAADKNNPNALYSLATLYAKGDGVALNTNEAVLLINKAAALNHLEAICDVGVLYESGQWGVSVNQAEAAKAYTRAANLGHTRGMYLLGVAYYNGIGVTKNMQACRTWLEKASARDYQPAKDAITKFGGMMK